MFVPLYINGQILWYCEGCYGFKEIKPQFCARCEDTDGGYVLVLGQNPDNLTLMSVGMIVRKSYITHPLGSRPSRPRCFPEVLLGAAELPKSLVDRLISFKNAGVVLSTIEVKAMLRGINPDEELVEVEWLTVASPVGLIMLLASSDTFLEVVEEEEEEEEDPNPRPLKRARTASTVDLTGEPVAQFLKEEVGLESGEIDSMQEDV